MLELMGVSAAYGAIKALNGIDLHIHAGEVVTLIGANGAGKSTTLRCIVGLVHPCAGDILFEGQSIRALPTHQIVARGISLVPEGRAIFSNLTVLENLEMGAYLQSSRSLLRQDLEHVYSLFPRLAERKSQEAGTLSGGEQQMLAIGRSLMSRPRLLLLDEPSLGLAPILAQSIFQALDKINREGITILLVEQNAKAAFHHSSRAYVLETGEIVMQGKSSELSSDPRVQKAYLGEI